MWGALKTDFNQTTLVAFARGIKSGNYTSSRRDDGGRRSLLLVDDGWEQQYGDMEYRSGRFTDPEQLIRDIRAIGFTVSLWFHSQLNTDTTSFQQATAAGFLVRNEEGDVPGLTRWWNGPQRSAAAASWSRGVAGVVDLSHVAAADWHLDRLVAFRDRYDLDSLHFAGESYMPQRSVFNRTFLDLNEHVTLSAEIVASLASNATPAVILQSAYRCQRLPVLVRLSDGTSTWNGTAGLSSVVPSILTLGLIGYPFVLPESVGGPGYDGPPTKELYVRWLELSAFLPLMHLSIPPHFYDAETVKIARDMIDLHTDFVVPEILSLINVSASTLAPIIRPVWWIAPLDKVALTVSNEFLIGDRVLVAPVLEEGVAERDVYLPEGAWKDMMIGGILYRGPMWLNGYRVPMDKIPYFVRS
jgi:hypothetical protein